MALLSDFFLAERSADAVRYDAERETFAGNRFQHKRITDVELSILWSILRDEEWDSDTLDLFEMVFEADNGDRLIIQLPHELMSDLASVPPDMELELAEAWADTEELSCPAREVLPVVRGLTDLSRRALERECGMYLWIQVD